MVKCLLLFHPFLELLLHQLALGDVRKDPLIVRNLAFRFLRNVLSLTIYFSVFGDDPIRFMIKDKASLIFAVIGDFFRHPFNVIGMNGP